MSKRELRMHLLAVVIIIVSLYSFLSTMVITLLILIKAGNLSFIWQQPQAFRVMLTAPITSLSYPGLGIALQGLYNVFPIRDLQLVAFIISLVKLYLPFLCKIVLFISGIGFFFRKKIFRVTAIIALLALIILALLDMIFIRVFANVTRVYFGIIVFAWLAYYLTRPKIKEQFK